MYYEKEAINTGFNIFEMLRPKSGQSGRITRREVLCTEIEQAARELQVRELCFWICVNMVAAALGRCEFRTFRKNKEVREENYYLWNIEPNINQNSTAFLHKLVARLYLDNEVLIVDPGDLGGRTHGKLVIADSWETSEPDPVKETQYKEITVDDVTFKRTLRERDVLHLTLNHVNVRPVISAMCDAYERLMRAVMQSKEWGLGKHIKVHVGQVAQGEDGWEERFAATLQKQIRPFIENPNAVLPEFDGYEYSLLGEKETGDTRDFKALTEDIFDFTARGLLMPAVLVNGKVEATADANTRFLTWCVDPLCDQLQEEINRKRYGYDGWRRGDYVRVDSSAIVHFDIFANAANVEKLVGSGAYTVNNVLRAANQPTIEEPWADQHFLTRNIATMDEAARNMDAQPRKEIT